MCCLDERKGVSWTEQVKKATGECVGEQSPHCCAEAPREGGVKEQNHRTTRPGRGG
jgi:hypothetical protein